MTATPTALRRAAHDGCRLIRLILASWTMRAGSKALDGAIAIAERYDTGDARARLVAPVVRLGVACTSIADWLAPEIRLPRR